MLQLKLLSSVTTLLCFTKIATSFQNDSTKSARELLREEEIYSLKYSETDYSKYCDFTEKQLEMAYCKEVQHPESVFLETSQLINFPSNITYNPQVKCLQLETNLATKISNATFSSLPNLDYLLMHLNFTIEEFHDFPHEAIETLVLGNGYDFITPTKKVDAFEDPGIFKFWKEFNTNLDENEWDLFKKSYRYRNYYYYYNYHSSYPTKISTENSNNNKNIINSNNYNESNSNNNVDNIINLQLPNLKTLYIYSRNMTKDNKNLIIKTSSKKLKNLVLYDIVYIADNFVHINNITHLKITSSIIKTYKSLPNHSSITSLVFDNNVISSLHVDPFDLQHHPNLKLLIINDCQIYRFPKNTLKFNTKLRYLDLSKNCLSVLYNDTFKTNTALEFLNLFRNEFREVPNLRIRSLKKLYMNYNIISKLREDSFTDLENLTLLILSYNDIEYIHPNTFAKLSNLVLLDLTSNKLNKFVYQSPLNLKYLLLKYNHFSTVNDVHDLGNATLKYSDISGLFNVEYDN